MKKIFLLGLFLLISCGGTSQPKGITFSEAEGDVGYIHLALSNTEGAITAYRLRMSGEAMETVEQTISAEAAGVEIQGIPAGPHRTIQVQALNEEGKVLREGLLEDVTIKAGETEVLSLVLQAVPLVLNFKEGDYASNQRLSFSVLTDPTHRVVVEGFNDVQTGSDEILANSEGRLRFYPGILPAGDHTFKIFDQDSGKATTLTLHLWEGQDVFAAPLVSASNNLSGRFGQTMAFESYSENLGHELFPNIVEALWKIR